MGYVYSATDEERAAARLLREKGWAVREPACPICLGFGSVANSKTWGDGVFGGATYSTKPCPNGCPTPAMFFSATSVGAP